MDAAMVPGALRLGAAAFVIGLTGAMSPGPFLTVTITETVRRGRAAALMLLVGHALLEAALLVGFAFGLHSFLTRPTVSAALALLGGVFLLMMGGWLLRDAVTGRLSLSLDAEQASPRFGPIVQGAAVSLGNPYWTLWWATIGVSLAAKGVAIGPVGVVAFYAGHELADLAWYALVVQAVHSGKRFMSDRVYSVVIGVCATFLVILGSGFVLGALR